MRHDNNHIDDLIAKYLTGEATADEMSYVDTWVLENESNRRHFDHFRVIFSQSTQSRVQPFNADVAWEKVKTRIDQQKGKTILFEPQRPAIQLYLKIAASIILILGIGYVFFWYNNQGVTSLEVITGNQSQSDTLPDGSGVYLNKATQLSYSFDKKKKAHHVKLKGEAYFNIHHNNKEQFIVDAGGVFIRDIGTSFNVKAYPDSSLVEVVVEEGEVMFFTDTDSGLYLKKDGRGIYDKKTKRFTIAEPDPNITAYKTRFFSFTDADLGSVVTTLNQIYSTRLVIGDSLKSCRITVNFQNEDIEEIAGILAETLDLSVSKSDGQILLEGTGCSVQ